MARMVFGQWATGDSPATVEHFAASKLNGTKTACGITRRSDSRRQILVTWKDPKMVTCKRCRKEMGL